MPADQHLTPCRIYFTEKGKDGTRYILFSKPNEDNVIHALYNILGQSEVQDNYEGCEVDKVEIGNNEVLEIEMPVSDFK
jgi:RecB family exonuclease